MPVKGFPATGASCPFSPVDQGLIDRWIEDATKTPPLLFKRWHFDRHFQCDLMKFVGGEHGALVVEHVCNEFQLWSDGHEARMRRLRYAIDPRGPISAEGEFSLLESTRKPGKRTNQTVVAIVDFLVPVLLALGVPWGATTSAKMTRALDLVAVNLFQLPSTKSELQKRMRIHLARAQADRSAMRSLASRIAAHTARKAAFVGPPMSPEMRRAQLSMVWRTMPREQREAIRAALARGLESFKIQPPGDIRPIRSDA